jgi:predicted aminopeptidase
MEELKQASAERTWRVAALAALLLAGCQSGYVLQQGWVQMGRLWDAEEIPASLEAEPELPAAIARLDADKRAKLQLIGEVRRFAVRELGLAAGDAYTTYFEVKDEAVSWAVTAAHPLALVPFRWSFPFVGEVAYKGFFAREEALAEMARLQKEGWDTDLSQVSAYSTLGWFRDPVLSTMLEGSEAELVDVILHELTHRTVYFPDHTELNECLAMAVARAGAVRFLSQRHGPGSAAVEAYLAARRRDDAADESLARLRQDLEAIYRSPLAEAEKLDRKRRAFARCSAVLTALQRRLAGGLTVAPGEISLPPSNAFLLARGQYRESLPLFEGLLELAGGEPRRLIAWLRQIEREPELPQRLAAALAAGQPIGAAGGG